MSEDTIKDLAELELPFGRRALIREVIYESGLRMVRMVLREGTRITQIDLDEDSANQLAAVLQQATSNVSGSPS